MPTPVNMVRSETTQKIVQHPTIRHEEIGEPAARLLNQAQTLSYQLQKTLDLDQLIQDFFQLVEKVIPLQGLSYRHAERHLESLAGRKSHHHCLYNLMLSGEALGSIQFFRRKKFTENETITLEFFLNNLIYPLRNALLYDLALRSAYQDPLTGVDNRRALDAAITREVRLAKRHRNNLSLMMIDADHFKQINDRFGHAVGDKALQGLVRCAKQQLRETDMLFRFGGEEFVVLLRNTDLEGAALLAERIRESVENCDLGIPDLQVKVSIGVASYQPQMNEQELFALADRLVYQAKADGRNCVRTQAKDCKKSA